MPHLRTVVTAVLLLALSLGLNGCDDPKIYGSIGVSSYSGYGGYHGGGPRVGGSISFGGRIF